MPRRSISYENTYFYKICCKDLNVKELYVGHTVDFTNRKSNHKTTCNNPNAKLYPCKLYTFIRDNGGWDNWDMVLLDVHELNSSLEARRKEREYVESLNAQLNTNLPSRSHQEWKNKFYNENKEFVDNRNKLYYYKNKESVLKQQKLYLQLNKDKLNQKIVCPICNHTCTYGLKYQHVKTQKHLSFISNM